MRNCIQKIVTKKHTPVIIKNNNNIKKVNMFIMQTDDKNRVCLEASDPLQSYINASYVSVGASLSFEIDVIY